MLLSVADPCRHSWRGSWVTGLVDERRTLAQGDSLGNRLVGATTEGGGQPATCSQTGAWEKTQLAQGGWRPSWGKLRDVKRLPCDIHRRPARVEAAARLFQAKPQVCRAGRGDRRTPTDWLRTRRRGAPFQASSVRSDQPRPPDWCPAGEGLITPTAGRGPRTKGLSLRPSARAACEGLNHSASAASLLGDLFGATRA